MTGYFNLRCQQFWLNLKKDRKKSETELTPHILKKTNLLQYALAVTKIAGIDAIQALE